MGSEETVHLARAATADGAAARQVAAEDVGIALVHRRPNVVELGDERVFQPIDTSLRRHDGEHRLCVS